MAARRVTRRSLLAGGAGLLAGALDGGALLLHPGRALAGTLHGAAAALGEPPPARLTMRRLGSLRAGETVTVHLARGTDLVGLVWDAGGAAGPALSGASPALRLRGKSGRWGGWVSAGGLAHGPDRPPAADDGVPGEPVWTAGARVLEVRAAAAVRGVRVACVDVSAGLGAGALAPAAAAAGSLALAQPRLQAGPGQPPVIARSAWAGSGSAPSVTPAYDTVTMAFVHHTENPNGYGSGEVPAMLRAIYAFHRYVNGWNDIGYNFVIDSFGRVFEARAGGIDEPVVGAHAGGYNHASTGVAVLGSYGATPISSPARAALARLLAWKLSLHGVPVQGRTVVRVSRGGAVYSKYRAGARVALPRIAGHRDADSTECPGDRLYGELPALRARAAALASGANVLAFAAEPRAAPAKPPGEAPEIRGEALPPPGEASPAAPATAVSLSGALTALATGAAVANATVLVQARSVGDRGRTVLEETVAQALTGADGRWTATASLPATRRGRITLRALYEGAGGTGACVSEGVTVATAVAAVSAKPAAAPTR
ncbi:MAG TPA: N-acetylmuramoyl-L-alanine amidase [Solirubrobacteraceae bacterium]|jgi:hypothetical protein|nr:N-acetylmuramoyl-L-alanine amidase [Solirubrobacteraceae bacterium]